MSRNPDIVEIERLRAALQALHDWHVEYARINNLFNDDGSPGTFHELLEARRVLAAHGRTGGAMTDIVERLRDKLKRRESPHHEP